MAAHYAHNANDMSADAGYYTQEQQTHQGRGPGYQHLPTTAAQSQSTAVSPAPTAADEIPTCLSTAQAWLQEVIPDLQITPPHIIPAIAPGYNPLLTQDPRSLYLPRGAWNVRNLSPRDRLSLFVELREYARVMRDNSPASVEYSCAFQLVCEKSAEVWRREMVWYGWFSDVRNGELAVRKQMFKSVVMHQAQGTDIGNGGGGSAATASTLRSANGGQSGDSPESALTIEDDDGPETVPEGVDRGSGLMTLRGEKRLAPCADLEAVLPVAKKAKTETDTDDMIKAEVDRLVREGKEEKAKADHQRYLDHKEIIDSHYLKGDKTRKLTDPEWQKLAVWDSRHGEVSSSPKLQQSPGRRQGDPYVTDTIKCPIQPSRDLASYPVKRGDTYVCFHLDSACGGQDECGNPNHECCRRGLTLRELEKKVELKEERVCSRIEELAFKDGKLDQRHKTWSNWFSKALRDRDNSRVKAQVQPLGWTQASRDLAEARMSRVVRPAPVQRQSRNAQHVGSKQPQPREATVQNQVQEAACARKREASSPPSQSTKDKGLAPPVRQPQSPSPSSNLCQGQTKSKQSQPRDVASGIPHSHQMPGDVQANQNTPQYRVNTLPTAPTTTPISAVQPVYVQRNIMSDPNMSIAVVPKPVGKLETNYQLAAMEIVKKQIGQQEPLAVAGIKISKAEVNDGIMDCVRRVAKALRAEAKRLEVEAASRNDAEPIAGDDEEAAWNVGSGDVPRDDVTMFQEHRSQPQDGEPPGTLRDTVGPH